MNRIIRSMRSPNLVSPSAAPPPSGRLRPSEPVIGPAEGGTRWTGYGEGRGEGASPQAQTRGNAPSPTLSPQAGRGAGCGQFQVSAQSQVQDGENQSLQAKLRAALPFALTPSQAAAIASIGLDLWRPGRRRS